MKHVFSVLSVASVAFFTLFLSTTNVSCKKGDDGAKGDTGTANVIFSKWQDVIFTPQKNTAGDTVAWIGQLPAPKITQGILDSGIVKVYLNAGTPADQQVIPCPFTDLFGAFFVTNLNLFFTPGNITFYATDDAGTINTSSGKAYQFRYVIVPGGVPAGRSATVDMNNYEAVKSFYNLKD